MLKDNRYTRIDEAQIVTKTGKSSEEWYKLLDSADAQNQPGSIVCAQLITDYGLSKYWARTLYIRYQWSRNLRKV